jgi:hypothetical protein
LHQKDLAEFRRGGNYGISGPLEISVSGAEIPALGKTSVRKRL